MEPNTIEQKYEILTGSFPLGSKVCNIQMGSVGFVVSSPRVLDQAIFLRVRYEFGTYDENVDILVPVKSVRKGNNA